MTICDNRTFLSLFIEKKGSRAIGVDLVVIVVD